MDLAMDMDTATGTAPDTAADIVAGIMMIGAVPRARK